MSDYTLLDLDDCEDRAPAFGMTFGEARFPRAEVGATQTGFAFGAHHDRDGEIVQDYWQD